MILKAGRLWRTLRHLRPVQLYGRLWFRLNRPRVDFTAHPALRPALGTWNPPAEREPSMTAPTRFRFLNAEADLGEVGWDDPARAKLWRYNQHYFEDLTARGWRVRAKWHEALIADWIAQNPPGQGTGWEPYPTSLRIINWIKWAMAGGNLSAAAAQSLAVQARWLLRRLEWHLLGNHLFINAKALTFAGLFFNGDEAERWLDKGLSILAKEIDEQFLSDGGQFELSPMYHALAVEDLLDLANIIAAYPGSRTGPMEALFRARSEPALRWLFAMSHPDGDIAFFNDAAFGIAPPNEELYSYAKSLGISIELELSELIHLSASGYVRLTRGPVTLIADLARVGPDYLPGHAHADTLSFEMSFYRQRLFVNSGTSEYGIGSERHRQRSTAAHNCLLVENENSSEVWAGFRVGRRAVPQEIHVGQEGGELFAAGAHDGYRHLGRHVVPQRRFKLSDTKLIIEDLLEASAKAEARYHLHPSIEIGDLSAQSASLILPDKTQLRLTMESGTVRCEKVNWHPQFGISIPTLCLVLPLRNGLARLDLSWN